MSTHSSNVDYELVVTRRNPFPSRCSIRRFSKSFNTHSSVVDNLGDDGKLALSGLVVRSVDEDNSASLDQSPVNALHFGHC